MPTNEQRERRFLRLLEEFFVLEREGEPPLSVGRLRAALQVVMEAMSAQSAALLLRDVRTGELVMSASVGDGAAALAAYVRGVDEFSYVGKVASRVAATALPDVETTLLDVPDELRHSGVHSLLGARIPQTTSARRTASSCCAASRGPIA